MTLQLSQKYNQINVDCFWFHSERQEVTLFIKIKTRTFQLQHIFSSYFHFLMFSGVRSVGIVCLLRFGRELCFQRSISFQICVPVSLDNPQILLSSFYLNYFLWKRLAESSVDYPVRLRYGCWKEMSHCDFPFFNVIILFCEHHKWDSICLHCT